MPDSPTDNDRLSKIEMLLSHLQHDIDKLNEALISQQTQIDGIHASISRVESDIEQLAEAPSNPLDEKPPHY